MSDQQTTDNSKKPAQTNKLPLVLWIFLGVLITVVVWQQFQISRLDNTAPSAGESAQADSQAATSSSSLTPPPSRGNGSEAIEEARRMIELRAREVRRLNPEATGQRMFEELKFVTGEDQTLLASLTERLVIEGRTRREYQEQASRGEINQEQLTSALQQLVDESEAFAEELLDPAQFDRYREVRQSWRRGRAHPHGEGME